MNIIKAEEQHMDIVRDLFREYQAWLNADCCFQGFEEELASLPGRYAEPKGVIFLAFDNNQVVGCSAIRPRNDKPEIDAELKRLYVKETYRGHGVGKDLFNASMLFARELNYESVVLETLPEKMKAAQFLYGEYGFKIIPAYGTNSDDDIEYYGYSFENNAKTQF